MFNKQPHLIPGSHLVPGLHLIPSPGPTLFPRPSHASGRGPCPPTCAGGAGPNSRIT